MKRKLNRFVREYFSYSKKERRGMLVLTGILFLLLLARIFIWYLPGQQLVSGDIAWIRTDSVLHEEEKRPIRDNKGPSTLTSKFPFDPNLAGYDELRTLGFSEKQANGLIRFRNSGAVFRKKEDLLRLYVMTPKLFAELEPWIRLDPPSQPGTSQKTYQRENTVKSRPDINSVDSAELTMLKGIGAYTASKVIRYRSWLGGFSDTGQYREINGLREEAIVALQQQSFIDGGKINRIAINQATEKELWKHPYIRNKAKIIVRYKNEHGLFQTPEDLLKTGVIDEPLLHKLLPYITF